MEIIIVEEAKKRLKQNNQYGWAFVEYLFVPRKYVEFFWGITLVQSSWNYH
jgi:hypothetical protein